MTANASTTNTSLSNNEHGNLFIFIKVCCDESSPALVSNSSYHKLHFFQHFNAKKMAMTRHRAQNFFGGDFSTFELLFDFNSRHTRLAFNSRLKEVLMCFSTRKQFNTRRNEEKNKREMLIFFVVL